MNGSNIVTVLEEVGGEGVAEGVRSDPLVYSGKADSIPDGPLEGSLVDVVTASCSSFGIDI